MAILIPNYVHCDCQSKAEIKLFNRLRDELSDNYVILHSLGVSKHKRKIRSEIDFVIASPRGILIAEVKGGRIEYKQGVWYFTNRYGDVNAKRESPFEQASSNMYALKRSIQKQFGTKSVYDDIIFGYFVIFPDIKFSISSPSWDSNRIVDNNNINSNLQDIIEQQFDYSQKEISRVSKLFKYRALSKNNLKSLVQFMRGDFEAIPSLSIMIDNSYRELVRLTEEQFSILDQLEENPRVIVHGRAGTGKTIIAVEKARRAARQNKKVFYVCFNRLLAKKIQAIIKSESLESHIKVSTLHSYAKEVIDSAGLSSLIQDEEINSDLFMNKYPAIFLEAILDKLDKSFFDLIIVDEGQDLRHEPFIQMLDLILNNGLSRGEWLWFEDDMQNIFNRTSKTDNIELNIYKPVFCRLTKNCRNTKPISIFTSLATGSEIQTCLVNEGPVVETYYYSDNQNQFNELEKLIRRIIDTGLKSEDIIILGHLTYENSSLYPNRVIADLPLVNYTGLETKDCIRFSTIQSFKGLESKSVIIIDIDDFQSDKQSFLNYVGFTRAMSWLAVFINENARKQYNLRAQEFGIKLAGKFGYQ